MGPSAAFTGGGIGDADVWCDSGDADAGDGGRQQEKLRRHPQLGLLPWQRARADSACDGAVAVTLAHAALQYVVFSGFARVHG